MTLLRTTALVQLLLHIVTSWPLSPILYCSAHFSVLPMLYTPHSFRVPHHPPAATCDLRYLKQSTSSNDSSFSITCTRPLLPYLEHLITLLLHLHYLSTFFFRRLYQTHSPVYTTSPPSRALVLYYLQITTGVPQTCVGWCFYSIRYSLFMIRCF